MGLIPRGLPRSSLYTLFALIFILCELCAFVRDILYSSYDVASPYSQCDFVDLEQAIQAANLPINPHETYGKDHIEWTGLLRLCLPPPDSTTELCLWQADRLTIKTVSPAELIASKLIRYDQTDQSDIRFLYFQAQPSFDKIKRACKAITGHF